MSDIALAKGEKFLEDNAKKEGVQVTASGLQYLVLTEGTGKSPKATDTVEVHYEGTLINGTVFDSSYQRKESIEFPLNRAMEHGVGRMRSAELTVAGQFLHRGRDDLFFLAAEDAVFPRVRIESGHGDARFAAEAAADKIRQQFAGADDFFAAQQTRHLAQRHMDSDESDGDRSAGQAHGKVVRARPRGKKLRLAGEGKSR
jgi:hypothetical protein